MTGAAELLDWLPVVFGALWLLGQWLMELDYACKRRP